MTYPQPSRLASMLFAAIALPLWATAAQAETFEEAAALTLKAHPALQADQAQVRAAAEAVTSARSGYFPQLEVDSELNTDTYTRTAGNVGLMGREAGLQASQVIFDGLSTGRRVDSATAEQGAASAGHLADQNQLILAVARAYVAVLRDRSQLEAARRNLAFHRESVAKLKAIASYDKGKAFDLTQVAAREARAIANLTERQAALAASEAAYREIVGQAPGELAMPETLAGPEFKSLDEALRIGQVESPLVKSAEQRVHVRQAELGMAWGGLAPRVDAVARYVKGMDRQSLPGQNDEAYAGVRASYAFPTGLGTIAQARSADLLLKGAQHKLEAAKRDVRESVRVAWVQREGVDATLPLAVEHWKRIGAVLDGFKTQYSLGRRTVLDLLIVQDEAYQAETRKIQLEFDRRLADYVIAGQAGTLVARFVPPADTPAVPGVSMGR
jgi:TolC family type I secretion outer membrane protein